MPAEIDKNTLQSLIDRFSKEGNEIPSFSQETIEAFYSLGYGYYQNGKYEQAIHFFRFLTLIDTENPKHWMGLGAALQMIKQYHHAIQCFGYAAVLNPKNPYAPFHAAECYLSLGEENNAAEVFDAAVEVANKNPAQYKTILTRITLMNPRRPSNGRKNRK